MPEKFITVFHKSSDCSYLVEVKKYARLYAARRWARQHPNAFVYVKIDVGSDALPIWLTFGDTYGPNTVWIQLKNEEVLRLPELLAED